MTSRRAFIKTMTGAVMLMATASFEGYALTAPPRGQATKLTPISIFVTDHGTHRVVGGRILFSQEPSEIRQDVQKQWKDFLDENGGSSLMRVAA